MRALPDAGSSAHPHQLLPLLLGPSPYDTSPRDEPMCLGGQLLSSTDTRTTGGVRAATLWPLSPHSPKLGDTPALGLWGTGRMHSTRPPAASYPAGTGQAEGSRCVPKHVCFSHPVNITATWRAAANQPCSGHCGTQSLPPGAQV